MPRLQSVHYIWIGKLIPKKYITNIAHILSRSSHNIYMWTDQPEKTAALFDETLGYTNSFASNTGPARKMHFMNIARFQARCEEGNELGFLSPPRKRILAETFRLENSFYADRYLSGSDLEIWNRFGNLATLSDVLRVLILYLEGGIYIDCDNTFRSQSLKYKEKTNWQMQLDSMSALYSMETIYGNSVLASNPKAKGSKVLLEKILDRLISFKTGRKTIEDTNQFRSMVFKKGGYLEQCFDYFVENPYIRTDNNLRRHGKLDCTLKDLKNAGEINGLTKNISYPYLGLAVALGPGLIGEMEREASFSKRLPDSSLASNIFVNSDQAWL